MAFIESATAVFSFADYSDVTNKDDRLFVENEGLSQTVVEDLLVRSTERILSQLRSTGWWYDYNRSRGVSLANRAAVPALDAKRILARKNDFSDLCVYHALYEQILPRVADFGSEENAERQKIGFYQQKYDSLFNELISSGDWYDFDNNAEISTGELEPGFVNPRRIR
jgi:hypothetical protein